MRLVDLSRELSHREPSPPGGVPPQVWVWRSHAETAPLYTTGYSFTNRVLTFPDHTSTHVDAPRHFDSRPEAPDIAGVPLDWFYGPAVCLDVSTTRHPEWIDVDDLAGACERHGLAIASRDIVLLASGHYRRTWPRPEFFTDHAGLTPDAVRWLHGRGCATSGWRPPIPATRQTRTSRCTCSASSSA